MLFHCVLFAITVRIECVLVGTGLYDIISRYYRVNYLSPGLFSCIFRDKKSLQMVASPTAHHVVRCSLSLLTSIASLVLLRVY